jgi:hypothetical protein
MSRFLSHIALVLDANNTRIGISDLTRVGAALNRQLNEHFAPLWNLSASISAFADINQVPAQYAPIYILDHLRDPRLGGYHKLDQGRPFAIVGSDDPFWTVDASHECLEMVVDPSGDNTVVGDSPDSDVPGRVEFVVEICDPCGREDAAYLIDGIFVADFHTPQYFDSVAVPGARYSFGATITEPKQLLPGGYITWHDIARDKWFRHDRFASSIQTVEIPAPDIGQSLREHADYHSALIRAKLTGRRRSGLVQKRAQHASAVSEAACSRGVEMQKHITRLKEKLESNRPQRRKRIDATTERRSPNQPAAGN